MKHKFLNCSAVLLFFCLSVFFFPSMEVYLKNIAEFTFPATHVWWITLLVALISAAIATFLIFFLPDIFSELICILFISLGICFYIQSIFLNSSLQELNGENTVFSISLKTENIAIWFIIFSVVICGLLLIRKETDTIKFSEILTIISVGMIVIQASGLLSTFFSVSPEDSQKDYYLSTDREFELSSGNNVIFFILDNCDKIFVDEAISQDPYLFDEFSGFICYPNAVSKYSRTYPSVPYLLTHEFCDFSKPYTKYISDAYQNSNFFRRLTESEADLRLYTSLNYIAPAFYDKIDNVSSFNSNSAAVLSVGNLIKAMGRLGGYKVMPYFLKGLFSYTIDPINRNVLSGTPADYYTLTNDDFGFYSRLISQGITCTDDYPLSFRFYHLFGPHPGCFMDENLKFNAHATQAQTLRGDIAILNHFLSDMKAVGVYDNSTIIITADHGNQNPSDDLLLHNPVCCIMLVKPAGQSNSPVVFSQAPVCHDDLFSVILDGLKTERVDSSPAIYDFPENSDRERYYYYTAQKNAVDGEVALREYQINGDARDFLNWNLTGNYWDIDYSANSISKTRLES